MQELFFDSNRRAVTADSLKQALLRIGAAECDALFIHSDVMFGHPAPGFRRSQYLSILHEIIFSLNVRNLIVPTFTYSFCNGEDYYVAASKTSMGVFNEYLRKQPDRYRTDDPLLSVSVPESLRDDFSKIGNHSLGKDSAFDVLHHMKNVKFLFFGAEMAECFTYVHFVEKMLDVPYRFDMPFTGNIIYPDGAAAERTQYIHTQCTGARLLSKYTHFEKDCEESGILKKMPVADKYVACISESDAYEAIALHLSSDINYFLEKPFLRSELVNAYTYSRENGRITHC